jgi:hypothetical protein
MALKSVVSGFLNSVGSTLGSSGSRDTSTFRINEGFATFLGKGAFLGQREDVEYGFRGPAEPDAPRCDDDRSIDKDGKLQHLIDQFTIRPVSRSESQLVIRRAFLAKQVARPDTHPRNERFERRAIRRGFQILDDGRLNARVTDQR